MFSGEWPLLMFTLLSQLAIGSFVLLLGVQYILQKQNNQLANDTTRWGMMMVGPVMALALILSLFHLGKPFSAYLSITNLATAWLSREILTAGGFFVLWVAYYYLFRKNKPSLVLGGITAIFGLAAVYSMANIYSNSINPAWIDPNTQITFFATTFVLGVIGTSVSVLHTNRDCQLSIELAGILKKLAIVAVLAALIPLLYLPVFIANLSAGGDAALASANLIGQTYAFQLILRWVLSLAGLGVLFCTFYRKYREKQKISFAPLALAFALVLAGEFLGRYIFYATAVAFIIG